MSKLRGIIGGLLADPYVTGVLGLLLLTRSLDGLMAQASQVQQQLAAVQAQVQTTLQAAASAAEAAYGGPVRVSTDGAAAAPAVHVRIVSNDQYVITNRYCPRVRDGVWALTTPLAPRGVEVDASWTVEDLAQVLRDTVLQIEITVEPG